MPVLREFQGKRGRNRGVGAVAMRVTHADPEGSWREAWEGHTGEGLQTPTCFFTVACVFQSECWSVNSFCDEGKPPFVRKQEEIQ